MDEQTKNTEISEKESKKTVRTFAAASFLNDMGSDMIYPIWPLFITTFLGADMAILGLIDGLGDAIVSISQAISGYYSDKLKKRKIFIWTGYFAAGISRLGYAIATTWHFLIPFKILDRAGKMRGAPRDAVIADVSTKENRGKNFGILRAMDNLGAVVGILFTIFLFDYLGYRNLFFIAAIPSVIATILIIIRVKEPKNDTAKISKGISFKDLRRDFWLILILGAIFSLASFSYSFLLIYAKQFGFAVTFVPVLYLIFTAVASLLSFPFGKLSDKIGRRPVLMISFLLWALVCLCFILFGSASTIINPTYLIILGFILYGLHKGAIDTVLRAFVADLAPSQYRASSLGGFQLVVGLCALPSSLIAGILWDSVGTYTPLYFSLGLTAIAGILLLFVRSNKATI